MRNHLHGLAEIIAAALLGEDGFVDAAGGPVVIARQLRVGEALVVAEIEIGLRAVIGDKHFAVLIRAHRAGINVQVGIALLEGDFEAAAFEQTAHRSRCYAFSERRNHAARYEDILRAASQVSEIPPLRCAYNALSGESPRVSNHRYRLSRANISRYPALAQDFFYAGYIGWDIDANGFVFEFDYADAIAILEPAQLLELLDALEFARGERGEIEQSFAAAGVEADVLGMARCD